MCSVLKQYVSNLTYGAGSLKSNQLRIVPSFLSVQLAQRLHQNNQHSEWSHLLLFITTFILTWSKWGVKLGGEVSYHTVYMIIQPIYCLCVAMLRQVSSCNASMCPHCEQNETKKSHFFIIILLMMLETMWWVKKFGTHSIF